MAANRGRSMEIYERKGKGDKTTFYLDYRVDGKRVRERMVGIPDRKTAELYRAKREMEVAKGVVGLPTREALTLGAALDGLLADKKAVFSAGHTKTLEARIQQIKDRFGTQTPLRAVTLESVNTWRQELLAAGESPATVNKKTDLLKSASIRARRLGLVGALPLEGLQRAQDPGRDAWRWLRGEEVERLLDGLQNGFEVEVIRRNGRNYKTRVGANRYLYQTVLFLLNTGARCGEMFSLTWGDVDLQRDLVSLYTAKHGIRGGKKRVRHIPMNQVLQELLAGLQATTKDKGSGSLVFQKRASFVRDFEGAAIRTGLGHVRPHDLRHTFASHLVIAGVPLNTVRELLGHTSMTMTLRYAHLAPEATALAVEKLTFGRTAEIIAIGQKEG